MKLRVFRIPPALGFDTIVVSDATYTFDKADFNGTLRTAAEVHAMSLANLHDECHSWLSTANRDRPTSRVTVVASRDARLEGAPW